MENGEKRIAVLIDADNVSSEYIRFIFDEVSNHGAPTIKRIYGDFTHPRLGKWKAVLLDYSIIPIQQYSYTYGKNSTDSALIIDAMDILYTRSIDGFCIVSSDSDFTRLASRLREAGMTVIGMGERKTPTPFVNACEQFKYLEVLAESNKGDEPVEDDVTHKSSATPSRPSLSKAITAIIDDVADADGWASLGSVGQRLNTRYPAFDSRNYGFKKLSHLVDSFKKFEVQSRIMPNRQEAQTFIRYTEGKVGKNKYSDNDAKAGKKSKKAGKDGFDPDKKKNGSKKKKGQRRDDFAPQESTEIVAQTGTAVVPPAETVLLDAAQNSPAESMARQQGPGFMNVAAAIAKFARPPREEPASVEAHATDQMHPAADADPAALSAAELADSLLAALPESTDTFTENLDQKDSQPAADISLLSEPPTDEMTRPAEPPVLTDVLPVSPAEPASTDSAPAAVSPETRFEPDTEDSMSAPVLTDLVPAQEDTAKDMLETAAPAGEASAQSGSEGATEKMEREEPPAVSAEIPAAQDQEPKPAPETEVKPKRSRRTTKKEVQAEDTPEAEVKPKRRTRAAKVPVEPAAAEEPAGPAETAQAAADDAKAAEVPKKRTRRTAKAAADTAGEVPAEEPKKRTRRTAKTAEDSAETAAEETPKKRTRRTAKTADATEESAPQADTSAEATAEPEAPKKRTRRTAKTAAETEATDETPKKRTRRTAKDADETAAEPAPKKRTRRTTKAQVEESAENDSSASASADPEPVEPAKPARKRRTAGTAAKQEEPAAAPAEDASSPLDPA